MHIPNIDLSTAGSHRSDASILVVCRRLPAFDIGLSFVNENLVYSEES